jgi:hypothetical protein
MPGYELFAEAGLYRHPLAAFGTTPREHRLAALGFHTSTKSVRLRAVTTVRLECTLGHERLLLLNGPLTLGQVKSINDAHTERQTTLRDEKNPATMISAQSAETAVDAAFVVALVARQL